MSIEPQQLEMFVASQFAESLGGSTRIISAWELNLPDQPNRRIRDPYVRWCGMGAQRWSG